MSEQYMIRYKEYDTVNNRLGSVIKTVTRFGSSQREVENRLYIQFQRCTIVDCRKI